MTTVRNRRRRAPMAGRFDVEVAAFERRAPVRPRAAGELPCQVHDPDLWFADTPGDLELAKALCAGCPAQPACLTGALDRREPTGVWGGQILDNGEIVTHKRPRGRPRKGSSAPQRHPARPLTASPAHAARHGGHPSACLLGARGASRCRS